MNVRRWDPFGEFEDVFERFRQLTAPSRGLSRETDSAVDWRPAANISESASEYLIKADLPEVKKSDVDVSVHEGMLTITGVRRHEKSSEDEQLHRVESFYGRFSRTFRIPDDVDVDRISAESAEGILRVHLPKKAEVKPKPVQVEVK